MIATKKELNLILKKLERSGNEFLVKDILRILLIQKKHQDIVGNVIKSIGIKKEDAKKVQDMIRKLKNIPDVYTKNNDAVVYYKSLSPACRHCVKDLGCTLRSTVQCNRNCFFCFADNLPIIKKIQPDITTLKLKINKRIKEVEFKSFAISGGEPFLYPEVVFKLLQYINKKFNNKIYTRVYTNGDLINENILIELNRLGLNEIRYSIKPLEKPNVSLLKLTKKYIPKILIEMPVLPASEKFMINLIYKLDKIGINGINLLELFFNGYHINDFKKRKYKIDLDLKEIREVYDTKPVYEYPIHGSKLLCLKLIEYFATNKAKLFINFCSQKTKQLQYNEKNKRIAIKNKPAYSKITNKNTHEILAIYSNIENAKNKILSRGKKDFYLRENQDKIKRLETNIEYLKYLVGQNYSLVKIYRDPSYSYDIDFDLLDIQQERQVNQNISKLINDFKYVI